MTFCQVILIGNVGRDPELKFTPSGRAVCSFSLAVNRRWTDRNSNERKEETTWFAITIWGQQGETAAQYIQKGSQIMIIGDRIEARAYTANDGTARASLEVTASNFRFLGGREGAGQGQGQGAPRSSGGSGNYQGGDDYYSGPSDVDDIPF